MKIKFFLGKLRQKICLQGGTARFIINFEASKNYKDSEHGLYNKIKAPATN